MLPITMICDYNIYKNFHFRNTRESFKITHILNSSTIIIPISPFQFKIDGKIALWENDPKIAFLTTDLKSSNLRIN